MPTENRKIVIRRGSGDLPSDVVAGELLLQTNTNKVFIGTGTNATKQIVTLGDLGVTVAAEKLNYTSEVTSSIQAQLNSKANLQSPTFSGIPSAPTQDASDNTTKLATTQYVTTAVGNAIDGLKGDVGTGLDTLEELADALNNDEDAVATLTTSIGLKAPLASPTLTGNPTAPTQEAQNNSQRLATTAFVATAIQNAEEFGSANVEWNFLQKITASGSTLSVTNSSLTNHTFDVSDYDYKFVVAVETSTEDNSSPMIRLNNISTTAYNYIYERATLDAVTNPDTGSNTSFGGYDQTNIGTGLLLGSASQDVAMTNLQLEFIVSQSVQSYTFGGSTEYRALLVEGKGSALAIDAPSGTPRVWPIVSRFSGSLTSSTGLTQVDIIHEITGGTTDNASVKIYYRAK